MHNQAKKIKLLLILAVSALLVSIVIPVNAEYIEQRSPYLWAKIGTGGSAEDDRGDIPGRWAVGTVLGNPETDADDNRQLNYFGEATPAGKFGYASVMIDENVTIYGHTSDGGWVSPGYYKGNNFSLYTNWQHRDSEVKVSFTMTVVRDVARFEYTIVNNDNEPHTVGLRLVGDTTVDSEPGQPGSGCAIAYPYIPGIGYPTEEIDISGPQIPEWFDMYNDLEFPTVAARNILRGQDATVPDRLAIGEWGNIVGNDWTYTAIPKKPISDWAWALWWSPRVLAPGATRKIVAYYGVSAASSSWTVPSGTGRVMDKYCLAVQGPLALKFDATKTPQLSGDNGDNKFEIKAYVYNFNTQPLTNVTVNLWLPEGLTLAGGSSESITVPNVPEGKESLPVTWTVYATGEVSGPLAYKVTATGNPGFNQEVTRSIMVPATLTSEVESGWQLMSMPFEFRNAAWDSALHFSPSIPVLDARLWDQADQLYKPLNVLQPGQGFWLRTGASAQLSLGGEPSALSGQESFSVPLRAGWNLVGNPYVYPVYWGRLSVVRGSDIVSIEEARENGWIRQTIFWWDVPAQEYSLSPDTMTLMQPFCGYWIRSLVDCQLLFPKVDQIGGAIKNTTTEAAASRAAMLEKAPNTKDSWRMRIVARAGNATDERNMFGVDTRAADGYDLSDVERPPSVAKFVAVTFPHRDWGTDSGNFWRDIRRSAGVQQSWDMEVSTDQANTDVVLTWPDLVNLPKDISLKLTDVDGNTVKYMRTTSSYRFNSGSSTTRKFKIVAESGKAGRLMITGLNVGKSKAIGGVTLSYALSTDASADVRIKSAFGKTVRNLAVGRGVTRGIANLSWNYRDDSGEPIPAGSYIVEVTATTPDGEVAKAVRPFMVAR